MKTKFKPFGLLLILIGLLIILLQPLTTITGAVINPTLTIEINFIIGLSILALGIILLATGLEELIAPYGTTKEFRKQTKRLDKKMIERTLEKIKKGLGHNKPLKYGNPNYSIRVDKGGRIYYQIMPDNSIVLTEYIPSSKHN